MTHIAQEGVANRVAGWVAARRSGHALARDFYLDPELFDLDVDLLLDRWLLAGHVSEVAEPGDFVTLELGQESAIVVRDQNGALHALVNVCRHRGSRVCAEARGHAAGFTCPYHAWTYRLDGTLRAAREMPPDFDTTNYGLKRLPLKEIGGLVFISFGSNPPTLEDITGPLEAMTTRYGWTTAKIAARRRYGVAANWKLALENYHECYHCQAAHPEFSILHALARPGGRELGGHDHFEDWGPLSTGGEVGRVMASSLLADQRSGSRHGKPVSTLMTTASGAAGNCVFAEVGFLSAFLAYQDHGVIYRFFPRGVLETDMEVLWLVAGDAKEGADYDLDGLTWLWDVTSLADKRIIETNQAGVRSRLYEPGPFSRMELGTAAYVDRYLGELRALLERRPHGL